MFPSLNVYPFAALLGLVPLLWALSPSKAEIGARSRAETSVPAPPTATATAARALETAVECRTARATLDAELEQLRQSCDLAVQEFEACRAARPEWRDVELFSCGFEMSTSLTRGDVEDPASIEDCGTATHASDPEPRANCPVPACEAELEELEAEREQLEETRVNHAC